MYEFNDVQKKRVALIVERMLDYDGPVSNKDIYLSVAQHLGLNESDSVDPTISELEIMVQSGKIARYALDHPKDAKVDAVINKKMPEYYYVRVKSAFE